MKKRMLAIIISVTLMLLTASGRLCSIMLSPAETAAMQYGGKTVTITVPRGTIYDCRMTPLTNAQTRTLAVIEPTAVAVAAVTQQLDNSDEVLELLKSGGPVLAEVVSDFECDDAIKYTVNVRYSEKQSAAHIIGYLDNTGNGVTGIEYAFNELLGGNEPLTATYRVDALGRLLSGVEPEISGAPTSDKGVVLTIDSRIQRIAEAAAGGLEKGAVVVMESETGKLRAACSFPEYSPLAVSEAISAENSALVNRVLSLYNVGSVFKLCVSAAALKNGITTLRTDNCTGKVGIGSNVFNCHLHTGHGSIDMVQALAGSCNSYYIGLGADVGASRLYDMCVRLGFNRAYSLAETLTASAGTLPPLSVLSSQPAALANFSFGQGDLMLTPLHVAVMVAAVANGGMLVTPSVVQATMDSDGVHHVEIAKPRRVLSEEAAGLLQEMMIEVVNNGTGKAARPEHHSAGGKTATAETGWTVDGKLIKQAWFAGFYGKYTIVVLREDGSSGAADCAPVFKQIADLMAQAGVV